MLRVTVTHEFENSDRVNDYLAEQDYKTLLSVKVVNTDMQMVENDGSFT